MAFITVNGTTINTDYIDLVRFEFAYDQKNDDFFKIVELSCFIRYKGEHITLIRESLITPIKIIKYVTGVNLNLTVDNTMPVLDEYNKQHNYQLQSINIFNYINDILQSIQYSKANK